MKRPAWFIGLVSCLVGTMMEGETQACSPSGRPSKAGTAPRKVVVGTAIFGPYGNYPGLDDRLKVLAGLIDDMARKAAANYPAHGLDLAILPETTVTSTAGPASSRAIRLEGPVRETFSSLARKHKTYIIAPMDLAEQGPLGTTYSNAAVLFDREGSVAGIYRKVHPVAGVGSDELERGIKPGREYPVFDCDFGKLGIQICFDIRYDYGWNELARKGAELVVWPTQSPETSLPAFRAMQGRYYVVSSTWRNNASFFEPTGKIIAQIKAPEQILVQQLDLSYAILPWSSKLKNGAALRDKYGDKVGFHYYEDEDEGIFWSDDPHVMVVEMVPKALSQGRRSHLLMSARAFFCAHLPA
jgi:predicted amidohydrolase